jgi:hypothetical protein
MPNQFWKCARYVCFGAAAWFAAMQHGPDYLLKQRLLSQLQKDASPPAASDIEQTLTNGKIHQGFLASIAVRPSLQ